MTTTIDDLPEGIFLHIFSFLPTVDAIGVGVVSRKWRNLWHSIPVLKFDFLPFQFLFQNKPISEVRQLFAEFVCQTLFLRQPLSPLRKFKLRFDYAKYGGHKCHVDSWIRYAIKSNAVELNLFFDAHIYPAKNYAEQGQGDAIDEEEEEDDDDENYHFHFSDLINSSVQVLKLRGCELSLPNSSTGIVSVKKISLVGDFCLYTSENVGNMVSLCVNLEYLSIDCNWDFSFKNLKLVSPKLKQLILSNHKGSSTGENSVEICAPSLVSIKFRSFFVGKYILRDISSLVAAHLYFSPGSSWEFACWSNLVISLTGVQSLSTTNMWTWCKIEEMEGEPSNFDIDEESPGQAERIYGKVPVAEDVFSKSLVFNNLKHLELMISYTKYDLLSLEYIFEICPKLEFLVLKHFSAMQNYGSLAEEMKHTPITFNMPSVREVKIKNYGGTKGESYVVGLLKKFKVVLEKIVAFPASSFHEKPDEAYLSPFVLWSNNSAIMNS